MALRTVRVALAILGVISGCIGPCPSPWWEQTPQTYLLASFDDAADRTGSGPDATGGPWDSAGVSVGTGAIASYNSAGNSAFVDAGADLEDSAKGFRFRDLDASAITLNLYADSDTTAPTLSTPSWVEFSFRLDSDASPADDALIHFTVFDSSGGSHLVNISLGKNTHGELRYKIYTTPILLANLGSLTANDEWRVLIRLEPPPVSKQTHWIWKNGEPVPEVIFGVRYDFVNPQTAPLNRLTFQTNWHQRVAFDVDEVRLVDTGPPEPPADLVAVSADFDRIDLTWEDRSDDEAGFFVERSPSGTGDWSRIASLGIGSESFQDRGLEAGTRHHYRVSAHSCDGVSAAAGPVSATTVYSGKPLSDWLNVRDYGAFPDDGIDDTVAIQQALGDLQGDWGAAAPQVLYFPDGLYQISDQEPIDNIGLRLSRTNDTGQPEGHNGLQFVGQSPGGVTLKWVDQAGTEEAPKILFHNNGNPRCIWRNLVWDGGDEPGQSSNFVVAYDESSLPTPDGWYDSATAHYDSAFQNAYIGLRIGHYHKQNSELTVRRCEFRNNTAGVSIEDWNALNIWLWDCLFDGNGVGVANDFSPEGAGDFRIIRGRFSNSSVSDVSNRATGAFTVQDSWSHGSYRFFESHLSSASSHTTLLRNNISGTTAPDGRAVVLLNAGPFLLLGNRIDSPSPGLPPVWVAAPTGTNFPDGYRTTVLALHNEYTVADPYGENRPDCCRILAFDDAVVDPFTVQIPALPEFSDPVDSRPIFTVSGSDNLHETVASALSHPASAIVHLPNGSYSLDRPLAIPAGSDLMLLGNGQTTRLEWIGADAGPMLEIDGHQVSGLTVRDLGFHAGGIATAIHVRDLNQEQSRVLLNQITVSDPSEDADDAGIVIDGCDRTEIVVTDSGISGTLVGADGLCPGGPGNVGIRVIGGPQEPVGTFVWTGSSGGNGWDLDLVNGPGGVRALVSAFYMEKSSHYARVRGQGGAGEVTLHGSRMAVLCSEETNAVSIEDFTGNVGVAACSIYDFEGDGARVEQSGAGDVAIQLMGNVVYEDPEYVYNAAATLSRAGENLICQQVGPKPPQVPPCVVEPGGIGAMPLNDLDPDPLKLDAGLRLLLESVPPGHYDETGAGATYQLNLDNLRIDLPTSGVVLSGGIPGAPTSPAATVTGGQRVDLAWTDGSNDEDWFRVERSLTPETGFVEIGTAPADETSFSDTTVSPGVVYHYRVSAHRRRTGDSAFSKEVSARPSGGVPRR